MRPTMTDVAKKAGVSIGTVSLVLNDKPGISSEVRSHVQKSAEELGYRLPQRRGGASSMTSVTVVHYANRGKDNKVPRTTGVLVNYIDSIQEALQDQGVSWTLLSEYQEGDRENLGFQLLDNKQLSTDGLILLGLANRDSTLLQRALAEDVPVVVLSRNWPDMPVSSVGQDHRKATEMAMDYLIGLGHRQIGFVASSADQQFDWFATRLRTYREAMAEIDNAEANLVVIADSVGQAVETLIARRPDVTAVFSVHDEAAVEVMITLHALGLRIPQEISVIGLDDSSTPPDYLPPLTTIGFPHREVGRLAAELLLAQIEADTLLYSKIFVRSHLVERDSCAPPRA